MQAIDRYNEFQDTELDAVILRIRRGDIKTGRYAHLVKIDKKKTMKGKEFFNDGSNSKREQEQ